MNLFLAKIISRILASKKMNILEPDRKFSNYQLIKGYIKLRTKIKNNIKDSFLIIIGIASAAFGFKGFLLTNRFIDGGATGISLLIFGTNKYSFSSINFNC